MFSATVQVMLLYFLSFLSGVAALVYEVSWSRQIGTLIGHTVHGAAAVLTSFFLGMALGYALAAWRARSQRAWTYYAIAELTIAGWASLVPLLLQQIEPLVSLLTSSPFPDQLMRWLFCTLILLPATIALGTTFPLMAQCLSSFDPHCSQRSVTLYAWNTTGGFVGVLTAAFGLMTWTGVRGASYWAALLSLTIGLIALVLSANKTSSVRSGQIPAKPIDNPPLNEVAKRSILTWHQLTVASLSGFGLLALEVYYTRLFSLVFHNSTYTFSAILAVALLSLALGAFLVKLLLKQINATLLMTLIAGAGAFAIPASSFAFVAVTDFDYFVWGNTFGSYLLGVFALVSIIVMPTFVLLGMFFPLVWSDQSRQTHATLAQVVGYSTFINAIAAALGAGLTSLLLIPILGLWQTGVLISFFYACYTVMILIRRNRIWTGIIVMVVFLGVVAPLVNRDGLEPVGQDERGDLLIRRWNSAYGWIDVTKSPEGNLKIRQNLHYRYGSTGTEAWRAYRQARIPLLLHGSPKDVLFLGLGTGLTAGGAVGFPSLKQSVVVELIPEVLNAARLLSASNYGVVDDPNFEMIVDDARHHLFTTHRRYDVIIGDLFVPWESETGYLYTVDHFRKAKERMKPGGLFCQWLPVYQMGSREFEMVAESFASVFPDTSLWWGKFDSKRALIALIGSDERMHVTERQIETALAGLYDTKPIDPDLRSIHDVADLYVGHWKRTGGVLNTDEFPHLEFSAPISHMSHQLLKGESLREYYDRVLSGLPDCSLQLFPTLPKSPNRRVLQKQLLFP